MLLVNITVNWQVPKSVGRWRKDLLDLRLLATWVNGQLALAMDMKTVERALMVNI